MLKTKEDVISEIKAHIIKCGGSYFSWYVGIAQDAERRLFLDHKVNKNNDAWIYRKAASSYEARQVERYFIEVLGTDGGTGGGDETSNIVYAYKKKSHTNP